MPPKCEQAECNKRASFGLEGQAAQFCKAHKRPEMVDVKNRRLCEFEECHKRAMYDVEGGKGKYCRQHKLPSMVDVSHKTCESPGCNRVPSFGIEGERKGQYCSKHNLEGMVDIRHKTCEYEGCRKQPVFGIEGGKPQCCVEHKTPEMIDVKNRHCDYEGCTKQRMFDIKGGKGRFCSKHKEPDMVNVLSKYCEYEGCHVQRPVFGVEGGVGQFCAKHKSPDMVRLYKKTCEYEGCSSSPCYDTEGGKGRFCVLHKTTEMVDVKNDRCEHEGCKSRPTFDVKDEKGRFCGKHRLEGMVDVKNKQCEMCTTHVYYGKPGQSPVRCAQHREKGMIRKPTARCKSCKNPAFWGTDFELLHCERHHTDDETNYAEKPCKKCGLSYLLDANGHCESCDPTAFKRAALAKQNALMAYLDYRGLNGTQTDRIIDGGTCGKERPDRVWELPDRILILECDEHQHRERACECEQTRMVNIGQSYGGLPVYFLRWNPDAYLPKDRKKDMEPLKRRWEMVGDYIQAFLDKRLDLPHALVSVRYFFFDEWLGLEKETWTVVHGSDDTLL